MAKNAHSITSGWKSLQGLLCSGEIKEKRPVVFWALRTEEFVTKTFSTYGLAAQPQQLYWAEFDPNGFLIDHYEYMYDEGELERIARNLLDSEESSKQEKLNARIAISLVAFKQEIFSASPDPWKLAAHASGLATITPTPKQLRGVDSINAKVKGKKGGRKSKKDQPLQEVINCIASKIKGSGKEPSASNVLSYLEQYESHSFYDSGVAGCEHLYIDGDSLVWTDYTQNGVSKSLKKRSLDPYVAHAKKSLSNSP